MSNRLLFLVTMLFALNILVASYVHAAGGGAGFAESAEAPVLDSADSPLLDFADAPTTNTDTGAASDGGSTVDTPGTGLNLGVEIFDPTGGKSIREIFQAILDIIMVFAVPIIVFFIIWAGFLYVTAAGNAEQIKKASNALLYAVIGGLIVLGANVLLAVITNTINAII